MEDLEKYIGTHVVVPEKDSINLLTKIRSIKKEHSSYLIGCYNKNPILYTRIYELEFPDCRVDEYLVNTLLKNIWNELMVMDRTPA